MKPYPFLKYSFLSMGRNLRRTFFSIVGVLIAISLIAGEGISIDSSVAYMIEKQLETIPLDFYGTAEQMNASQIEEARCILNNQSNVKESTFILLAWSIITTNESLPGNFTNETEIVSAQVFGVDATFIKNHEKLGWKGKIVVGDENATISRNIARQFGLKAGDQFFMVVNMTLKKFNVSSIIEDSAGPSSEPGIRENRDAVFYPSGSIFIDLSLATKLFSTWEGYAIYINIWVDRDKIVNPADPQTTLFNLKRMERNLNNALADYGITVSYNQGIIETINGVQMTLLGIRFLLAGLSLPVIVLGVYLGILGSELNYAERRREIGILKARGASDITIFFILIGESIFYGVIAGITGLLCGVFISRIFIGTTLSIFGAESSGVGFSLSWLTVGISIILAVILSLIASYRAAKNVSKISVREALQAYTTEEAKVPYKARNDIIMVSIALLTYAAMITISEVTKHPEYYGFQVAITLLCLSAIFMVLVPLAPFFLIIGLSRLVTRSSPKIYEVSSNALKPLLKELHQILQKNLKRNPRRASTVCMLISLTLAFGLFVSVTYDSQIAYDANVVKAEVGADIKVSGYTYRPMEGNVQYPPIHGNLTKLPGIKSYAQATVFSANAGSASVRVCALNGSAYLSVVPVDGSIFVGGDANAIRELDNGKAIITERFSKKEGYALGDTIRVTTENYSAFFKITAIVKYLPGFGSYPAAEIYTGNGQNATNATHLADQYFLFLEVEENKIEECASYIRENYGDEVNVQVYNEEVAKQKENPLVGSIYNFLTIEFAFAIVITAVGIAMIMFMAVLERKQEIANMVVRGASFGQVAKIIWGEGFTVALVGLILGLSTGALTAYVFNKLFELLTTSESPIARDVVFGFTSAVIVVVALLVLLLTTLLVVLPMKRLHLNEILRWRGG